MPAIAVEALDPTGAGDVFVAGFVTGTLAGWPLADRLAFAGLSAALSVQEFGGSLSAPGWAEIAAWWQQVRGLRGGCAGARCAAYAFLDELLPAATRPWPLAPRRPDDRLPPPGLSGPGTGRGAPRPPPPPAGKALGLVGAPSYSGTQGAECRSMQAGTSYEQRMGVEQATRAGP